MVKLIKMIKNDQFVQNDEILNDDHSEHSNHTNDEQISDNLPNIKDIQISEHSSSPKVEDTSVQDIIPIPNPPLPIPSVVTSAPQDRCAALAHECLFVDFLSEEEPKKVFAALKHLGWIDSIQDELNQFARNKMKSQLTDYDIIYENVPIFCDNTSAIAISNNPVLHSRTKQIDIRYHFIRDHNLKGNIELHFIPTQYQLVDIFSKPLDEPTFKRLIVELDMNIDSKPEASVLTKEN
ncbi:hypothetical protein Tco_1266445 [Tanacetum coccineum]